jgi:hypothetical protein
MTEEICKQNLCILKKRAFKFEQLINVSQASNITLLDALDNLSKTKDIDSLYKTLVSERCLFVRLR